MPRETRADSRIRITGEIMDAARRQLGDVGAAGLSLREVAREIGMVSSAVYRYVESRDDLLTRLIIESYDSLGAAAEQASAAHQPTDDDLGRWIATAVAIRAWALERPHEYLLLYGSPVPGYSAPEDTVIPGTRVTLALTSIVAGASDAGRLTEPTDAPTPITDRLADDLARLADVDTPEMPTAAVAVLAAWTQMFGLISFELTNQTRGIVTDHAGLFVATVARLGHQCGLRHGAYGM